MNFRLSTLASWLAAGMVLGAASTQILVGSGFAFPISPASLLLTMPLIGVAVFLATLPIAQYRREVEGGLVPRRAKNPNPFFAFRALVLSRATVISGAGFLGWHLGLVLWLLSFSAVTTATLTPSLWGIAGSAVMTLGGYLGQRNCRTPKDKDGGAKA